MNAYQLKRVAIENTKQKNNLITGNDFVTVPQLGYYSKDEFHKTLQGWASEGYEIVRFTHGCDTYYTQTKHLPSYITEIEEVVKPLLLYEQLFLFTHGFS